MRASIAVMAKQGRPDFNDPGYLQIGCPVMGLSLIGGLVLNIIIGFLFAEPGDQRAAGLSGEDYLGIGVGALAATLGTGIVVMTVVERVPALWRFGDGLLMAVYVAAPAGLVIATLLSMPSRIMVTGLVVVAWVGLVLAAISVGQDYLSSRRNTPLDQSTGAGDDERLPPSRR
jgi:hypothetical protein